MKNTNQAYLNHYIGQAGIVIAIIGMLLFSAPALFAGGKDAPGMHMDQYLRMAAENNPELNSIASALEARREMIPQAGALPDPEINIGYFINPDDPDTVLGRFSVSAMQMFPWYGTRQTRQAEQRAMAEEQRYALKNRRNMILADIQTTWFDYAALELTIGIVREYRELVSDLASIVQIRYETARAGTADLLRIQMEDQRLKTRIENLEDEKHAVRAGFNELTNRPPNSEIITPEALLPRHPAFPDHEIAALVKRENPERHMLEAREKAAGHRAALARLEGRPDIGIGLEVMGRDFTSMAMMPDVNEGYVGMLSVKVPLYRSRYDAKIRQALLEAQAVRHSQTQLENRLARQTEEALVRWRKTEREIRLIDDALIPRARQVLDVLKEEYAAGNVAFDEVLQVQRELLELSIERVNALAAQNKAVVQIEYLYAAWEESEDAVP